MATAQTAKSSSKKKDNDEPKGNGKSAETMPATAPTSPEPPTAPEEKVGVTPEQESALFAELDRAQDVFDQKKVDLDKAQRGLDNALRTILESIGSGPFNYDGENFSISHKGDRYFKKTLPTPQVRKIAKR